MNMLKLTLRYMKIQKKRTVLTIIGIVLAVALVSGTGILISSFINMRLLQAEHENGTWHYHVNDIADYKKAVMLKSNALIDKAGIAADDTYAQISKRSGSKSKYSYLCLNEYDSTALSMMPYSIIKGRMPKRSSEIVLGESALVLKFKVGDKIALPTGNYKGGQGSTDDANAFSKTGTRTFKVVGYYDDSMNYGEKDVYQAISLNPTGNHFYSDYVQMKQNVNFPVSIKKAVKDCGISTDAIDENGIVEWMGKSVSTKVRTAVITTFLILAAIILAVMILVIRNSFAMSVSEKISQIGTLRCLGASPSHIRSLVLSEALIIFIIALPIGFAGGIAAMAVVIAAVVNIDPEDLSYLRLAVPFWPFFATALLSAAAVLLSAGKPIKSTMKISMVDAVHGNGIYSDKQIRKNKKGRILGKIFGFSGMLAAKNIRRNPRQFRTTLISIIVSVVLFISVGGFSLSISTSTNNAINIFGGMDYEFSASSGLNGAAHEINAIEQRVSKLKTVSTVQNTPVYNVDAKIPLSKVPGNFFSVHKEFTGRSAIEKGSKTLTRALKILEVSRENYNTLHFSGNAPTYDELRKSKGALLCQTESFVSSGGRIATTNFSTYKPGDILAVTQEYGGNSINNSGDTVTINGGDGSTGSSDGNAKERKLNIKIVGLLSCKPWFARDADGYLIVAKGNAAMFGASKLRGANSLDKPETLLDIKYAKGTEEKADAQMNTFRSTAQKAGIGYESVYTSTNGSRKTYEIMGIFVYGFTAIIILISCINIFNTIHANFLYRKREIAMTRAVGMGQKQLICMLLLECALYGIIGTVWGSIIGVPLAMLLLHSFGHIILADISSPLLYVFISLAASVGIGILAGLSSIRKTLKSSIVEEIRAQE